MLPSGRFRAAHCATPTSGGILWGGRVRTPAPTAYPKVRLIFCRARCPHRAVSGRPSVPPLLGPDAPIGPFPGGPVCRPYGWKRTGRVGSANPGAGMEPHQRQFLQTQGPVARREFRHLLRFCAPEMFCLTKGVTPVTGVRGKATMSTKCSSGAVPGGVLVTLPPRAK